VFITQFWSRIGNVLLRVIFFASAVPPKNTSKLPGSQQFTASSAFNTLMCFSALRRRIDRGAYLCRAPEWKKRLRLQSTAWQLGASGRWLQEGLVEF